jgi:hypothetical protein
MTPSRVSASVVADRIAWIDAMLAGIRALPLDSIEAFEADPRNAAASPAGHTCLYTKDESCTTRMPGIDGRRRSFVRNVLQPAAIAATSCSASGVLTPVAARSCAAALS